MQPRYYQLCMQATLNFQQPHNTLGTLARLRECAHLTFRQLQMGSPFIVSESGMLITSNEECPRNCMAGADTVMRCCLNIRLADEPFQAMQRQVGVP